MLYKTMLYELIIGEYCYKTDFLFVVRRKNRKLSVWIVKVSLQRKNPVV